MLTCGLILPKNKKTMRILGLIAAYNEEPVLEACIRHYRAQGVELYLIDNQSNDRTLEIAHAYLGQGVAGVESMPRYGVHDWEKLLRRKQELAHSLEADWFIHLDPDEFRFGPDPAQTLAESLARVDAAGYNTVNFVEFTFVPTRENPEHEHPNFQETMRWYYPFVNRPLARVNAWKKQPQPVDLISHSGHFVHFPNQFIYPLPFEMRHYQFLSIAHAIRKYAQRRHPAAALARGMHGWREQLDPASIRLPSQDELNELDSQGRVDFSHPRAMHILDNRNAKNGAKHPTAKTPADLTRVPARQLLRALAQKIIRRLGQKK
jgi:hypothetical protein